MSRVESLRFPWAQVARKNKRQRLEKGNRRLSNVMIVGSPIHDNDLIVAIILFIIKKQIKTSMFTLLFLVYIVAFTILY